MSLQPSTVAAQPSAPADSTPARSEAPLGRLRTLTVPLGETADMMGLLDYLVHDDVFCWTRRDSGLIGFGELCRWTATGADRFDAAQRWWRELLADAAIEDRVGLPGTGPTAFGSFSFSPTSRYPSRLIVPTLMIGSCEGRGWLTQLTRNDDVELTAAGAEAELARWLAEEAVVKEPIAPLPGTMETGSLNETEWMSAVAAGVEKIESGALDKVVLARDVLVHPGAELGTAQVLRELAVRYRECWTYAVDGLIGSTPEMLIQVTGTVARARVLAGTLDRAGAPEQDDDYAQRVLAGSPKQRGEHQYAIESLTNQLHPFTSSLSAHTEPFVLELPNVWHLASDVWAELAPVDGQVPTSLALAAALHPTAAVCGTPTERAAELILELEQMDRGPYAGPVGWMDAAGNGEWGIALRGAVIENPGAVRLYAGCGIVAESDPAAELAETWSKFRPMLEALGMRASSPANDTVNGHHGPAGQRQGSRRTGSSDFPTKGWLPCGLSHL